MWAKLLCKLGIHTYGEWETVKSAGILYWRFCKRDCGCREVIMLRDEITKETPDVPKT